MLAGSEFRLAPSALNRAATSMVSEPVDGSIVTTPPPMEIGARAWPPKRHGLGSVCGSGDDGTGAGWSRASANCFSTPPSAGEPSTSFRLPIE